jgi:hypothetical protein
VTVHALPEFAKILDSSFDVQPSAYIYLQQEVQEENRPYYPNTLLEFRLADGIDVPDTLVEDGGVA